MYEANFEFNTNTVEFDSEINTKDVQANLILNITPDRTSQLINDSDYTTNAALNNAVNVLDERIDNIDVDIEAELDLKQDKLIAGTNIQINNNVISATGTTYTYEQGIASDTWVINHNLNKYPSVTLVDSAGTQFQGRVEYTDENNCIVYMNGATKGKAYLN